MVVVLGSAKQRAFISGSIGRITCEFGHISNPNPFLNQSLCEELYKHAHRELS